MKRLLPVLCLLAVWATSAHGGTKPHQKDPSYLFGWNLNWAANCKLYGFTQTIWDLQDRAENELKGEELKHYKTAVRNMGSYRSDHHESIGCTKDKVKNIIHLSERFLNFYAKKVTPPVKPSPIPDKKPSLEKAKEQCAEIGFTKGTEKFGDCVMKLLN